MKSYHQFLIILLIAGYFLANILDSTAELLWGQASIPGMDYVLFGILVVLIIINLKNLRSYLKGKM